MEERTFLTENDVTVTRSRIVIGNQTYPVANITSIRTDTKPQSLGLTLLMGFIGVVFLLAGIGGIISGDGIGGSSTALIGVVLIVVAINVGRRTKPTYSPFFGTAGGERRALESEDGDYVQRVAKAIDEALIAGR